MKREVSNKRINKRIILCVIVGLFLIAVSIFSLWFFVLRDVGEDKDNIFYYPINENENIFENKVYKDYVRDLKFGNAHELQLFNYENDYEDASVECKFFLDYFKTVICGDYENYPSFFVDDYFNEIPAPQFTMQMIYDPYVVINSVTEEEIDGKNVQLYNYHVEYRIFRNNGSFRQGVSSNVAVPQIYQLIKLEDESYRIFRILDVVIK